MYLRHLPSPESTVFSRRDWRSVTAYLHVPRDYERNCTFSCYKTIHMLLLLIQVKESEKYQPIGTTPQATGIDFKTSLLFLILASCVV